MFDRLVHGERRPGRKARALVRLPDASALQRHERCALAPALVSPITGGDPWGEARSASSWSNRVPVDGFPTSGPRFGKRPDQRLARLCRWPPSRLHRVDRTDRGGRGRPSRRAVRCRRTREGERQRSPLAARRPQAVTLSTGLPLSVMTMSSPVLSTSRKYSRALALKRDFETVLPMTESPEAPSAPWSNHEEVTLVIVP